MSLLTLNLYVKVAFNAYSGLEQVAVFAGETKDAGRALVLSAWMAAPAIVLIYVFMTGSMLTYVPAGQIDLAGSIPQVLAAAFGGGAGVWIGRAMILALSVYTICSYSLITAETSRLPLVAGWDALLPEWFTRLNPRFGTPVRSLMVIVGIAAVFSVLASLGTGREEAFQVLNTSGAVVVWFVLLRDVCGAVVYGDAVWEAAGVLVAGVCGFGAGDYGGADGAGYGSDCGGEQHLGFCGEGGRGGVGDQPGWGGVVLAWAAAVGW